MSDSHCMPMHNTGQLEAPQGDALRAKGIHSKAKITRRITRLNTSDRHKSQPHCVLRMGGGRASGKGDTSTRVARWVHARAKPLDKISTSGAARSHKICTKCSVRVGSSPGACALSSVRGDMSAQRSTIQIHHRRRTAHRMLQPQPPLVQNAESTCDAHTTQVHKAASHRNRRKTQLPLSPIDWPDSQEI